MFFSLAHNLCVKQTISVALRHSRNKYCNAGKFWNRKYSFRSDKSKSTRAIENEKKIATVVDGVAAVSGKKLWKRSEKTENKQMQTIMIIQHYHLSQTLILMQSSLPSNRYIWPEFLCAKWLRRYESKGDTRKKNDVINSMFFHTKNWFGVTDKRKSFKFNRILGRPNADKIRSDFLKKD